MKDPLHPTVEIETPEHVVLTFRLAGLGRRALATGADLAVQLGLTVAVGLLALLALALFGVGLADVGGPIAAFVAIAVFIVWWAYYTLCEILMNGQTPGKRWQRIRVIAADGRSIGFYQSAIRNLVRWADFLPMFYGIGTLVVLLSKRCQRLGDLAAGTLVVVGEAESLPSHVTMDLERIPLSDEIKAAVQARASVVEQSEYDYVVRLLKRLPDVAAVDMREADLLCRQTARALLAKLQIEAPGPVDLRFSQAFLHTIAAVWGRRSVGA